jgi:glycosyltransferase involved in cell wall biosynthesis
LVRWWKEAEENGHDLPTLQLIGSTPDEVSELLPSSKTIVRRPFLEEDALQSAYRGARALILPSEIEGFGLPALEAYYLGTPVCFVGGTSVDEVMSEVTEAGKYNLDDAGSLWTAVQEVLAMSDVEIREVGLKLREKYGVKRVVEQMTEVFESL